MENKINVIPLNNIDKSILEFIQISLRNIFNKETCILDKINVPENSFDQSRNQHNANKILNYLIENLPLKNIQDINLAILDLDIFVPSLNFVFGLAVNFPRICLISTARLDPLFYTNFNYSLKSKSLTPELIKKEKNIFEERILKEAVHEIGHTLGLNHCSNYKCVMYFSNTLLDTDKKGYNFCLNCLNILNKK